MTHKDTIAAISDVLPLELQLNKRFVNFDEKCKRNSNSVVLCHTMACFEWNLQWRFRSKNYFL